METASASPAAVYCADASFKLINKSRRYIHKHNNCNINGGCISVSHYPPSMSALQIQLPLQRRPKRKQPHPHHLKIPPPTIPPNSSTAAATTTSDVLRLMDILSLPIPIDIYASLIKECTDTCDATRAIELHAHINRSGLRPSLSLLNRLLLMYVSCGLIEKARQMFDKMAIKDSNSWAAMIAGYADNDDYGEAIHLFVEMQNHRQYYHNFDVLKFPVSWIIVCILKACVHTMNAELGRQIHGWLSKVDTSMDLFLSSSLINFYGQCGCLEGANFIFDHMSGHNTVIWTAKVVNHCREERFDEVLDIFKEMGRAGIKSNSFTFSSILRACARMRGDGRCGEQVHANSIKLGVESDIYVQCGLVDMYGKCGLLKDARRVFEMIEDKTNAVCWNAMLTGYIQHGFCIEAIKFLYQMKAAGMQPQESLLNEVRFACGSQALESKTDGICIGYE
ncbi:hypothetical protein F0562_011766 [Nyssa sinensis]|uniref:Pentacotripeptide-repeat region of PRORP domain-containing protein n=1 Tax=Nyssa sinensis TaxID=561372 RepID=A0A5J4ZVC4_9ASTE|nr:hypothetical protein F0562_011766 [Nyssa sinensis]